MSLTLDEIYYSNTIFCMRNIILLVASLLTFTCNAQKKIDHQYFQQILAAGDPGRVFREATQLRKDVYGKCAFLDYYIGKSLCLSGFVPKSREWFHYILDHYPLKQDARDFISNEIVNCAKPVVLTSSATNTPQPLPVAGVSGVSKSGPTYDCKDKSQLITYSDIVSDSTLESRLFPLSEKNNAIKKIQNLVGREYQVNARDKYILVTPEQMQINADEVKQVTDNLEKAKQFFASYYGLRAPDKLITVYLAGNWDDLKKMGAKVHNLIIPETIYGYSVLGDLSLLGIASPDQIGTLYHELFHLIVRTDAGDLPAWLDEGMASLYSTSYWQGDVLMGGDSWRIAQLESGYLSNTGQQVPLLDSLVNYNWQEFNGGAETDLCRAAVNYALANHFLLFIQSQNKLRDLVNKFSKRPDPGDQQSPPAPDDTRLLEEVLQKPIEQVQKEFSDWLLLQSRNVGVSSNINSGSNINRPMNEEELGYGAASFDSWLGRTNDLLNTLQNSPKSDMVPTYTKKVNAIEKKYRKWETKYNRYLTEPEHKQSEIREREFFGQSAFYDPLDINVNKAKAKMNEQKEKLWILYKELKPLVNNTGRQQAF